MDAEKLLSMAEAYLELTAKKKKPWSTKPKGWKNKSIKKYYKTMSEGSEHPFAKCIEKMKKHMDSPEEFCASVKDKGEGTTKWRNPPKKKKSKK